MNLTEGHMLHQGRHKAAILVLAVLSWFPAVAQPPAPVSDPPEINTRESPARFRTGVNLVLVPVVVRDPQGRAVGNLRREDFRLEDNGRPQVITRFTVERPGAAAGIATSEPDDRVAGPPVTRPASASPQHFVAYFFDDIHLGRTDLQRARAAAERHLSESLDPADRAAIYTASGRTALEFTDERERLRQALERIQPYQSAGYSPTDCPHVDYYAADLIVNKHDHQALALATNDALGCLAADLKHPSAALPQAAEGMARSAAGRVLRVGQTETRQSLTALRSLVLRMAAAPGSRSIVLISSGLLLTTDDRANETDVMERAIRANVTINSLDARGLFGVVGGEASQPTMNGGQIEFRVQYESAAALRGTDPLEELADATGGRFFHNSNDLREGLQMLAAQPEFLYVLGFAPQDLRDDGSFHPLKISLRNPDGFGLQSRRGYYAPRHATEGRDDASEQILEEVFSRENVREIPLALNMRYVKTGDFKATLSVIAQVDPRSLRFRKDGKRSNDDLTVVAAVFDGSGNFITGGQKVVEMHLRDETLAVLSASGIRVRNTFDLTPGSYRVRVVARDMEGRTMASADGAIQIP
jgi:VWFA-related protein